MRSIEYEDATHGVDPHQASFEASTSREGDEPFLAGVPDLSVASELRSDSLRRRKGGHEDLHSIGASFARIRSAFRDMCPGRIACQETCHRSGCVAGGSERGELPTYGREV